MLKKKILKFFLLVSISFCFLSNSFAIEPYLFVQEIADDASEALNKRLSKEEKIEKLKIIAENSVDIKGIGYYSLGSHRKTITKKKKEEYFIIFKQYFLKSFSSRLAQYTDPKILVDSQKKLNEKYTMVSSVLLATAKRPEVKINWRVVTKNPDNPLIIDVIIEGVSLAKIQREEFNSIIQNNDNNIDALLKNLEEFVNKN
jgi:phospholipid transport system substrate-binding protein